MGIREFVKNVGEKILPDKSGSSSSGSSSSSKQQQQQQQTSPATARQQGTSGAAPSRPPQAGEGGQSAYERQAQDAILQHIKDNVTDVPEDLAVIYDADEGAVILMGTVDDDASAEVIIVTAGDIEGVCQVDDRMTRGNGAAKSSSSGSRGSQARSR